MKITTNTILLGLCALLSSHASALDFRGGDYKLFANPFIGYAVDKEETFAGIAIGAGNDNHSFALQYGNYGFELTNSDVGYNSFSFEYTFITPLTSKLNYYVGAGIGAADLEWSDSFVSLDDTVLFFDAKLGLQYNFNEHIALQLGGRYIYFGESEFSEFPGISFEADDDFSFEFGAKISF